MRHRLAPEAYGGYSARLCSTTLGQGAEAHQAYWHTPKAGCPSETAIPEAEALGCEAYMSDFASCLMPQGMVIPQRSLVHLGSKRVFGHP